ncbi:trigger factor [Saccharopolyspora erythraea NRRL 2338]|uniref:Trigger factor n=2 Tax=Saccharopolyspora erythraea TaxID=1836 RepID=TIG_SACEN|nr:trigger factor [Saccharopolyspora erythraea]A4F9F6.1 RecName: Full=Trigger factor; Short=TF; AltName: Full=PPIase [Saccharopolyspora erythraea NRRL 2338]EQD87372.1 trigger factor [Saccharopolyspora erythraea D]PFG94468.1 trigger factor [Saccharopolyspora erythraea NRRL 2338]QRK91225.1 trigger factor [Saccharopolyspora erythraea]CAM00681.1 putative cell division trigger factor [Saccharopolyspora erythraea NRRL 2338]
MKSTVEHLSPTRVRINVEVPFDELKPNFDRAYKALAQQVRIPGFRPGKVPARVLESRIGRGPVLDEVVNESVPAKYLEAVNSSEVRTLGRPDIEVTKIEDGDVIEFKAEVDVRPEITVPAFGELKVSVDDVEVTEEEVNEQLDELRARFGTLAGVERPAQQGDFVSIDLSATVDGQEVEEAQTSGLSYEIGSGQLIDGIDEALIGASEGETRTFTTNLVAGEHAGKDAEVTVKLNSVKERHLPEVDDEFAQMASEFDSVDELLSDLRERLGRVKRMQQGMQARDKVLEALLETVEVPLPEKVVESEIDVRKHDAIHPFDHDEDRFGEWLEQQGQTREQFEDETREEAEKAVRTQLVLDTIADAEDVSVSDNELTERIIYQAQRFGVSPDQYVQQAQQSGQLGAIYADVRRSKALFSVVRQATVTDEEGNELDLDELFGTQAGEEQGEQAEGTEATDEQSAKADAKAE